MTKATKADTAPAASPAPEAKVRVITAGKAEGFEISAAQAGVRYTIRDGAPYNPRVSHTQEAWTKMQKAFGTSGVATHGQLCDVLASHFTHAGENHHDFIGYMVRRKAIKIVAVVGK